MIEVKIKSVSNRIHLISINNHALQGREAVIAGDAFDMVCNSVSVLGQSMIIGLEEVLKLNVTYEIGEGHLLVDLKGLEIDEVNKAQILLKTFDKSLESITLSLDEMFGVKKRMEYIKIIKEEV